MVNSVGIQGDRELLLPGEAAVKKGFWQGRAIDFFCGGKDKWKRGEAISMHVLILTITALASWIITYSNVKLQNFSMTDTILVNTSEVLLFCLVPGSMIVEMLNCKHTRKCASFSMVTTAALVTASATILILRGNAEGELLRYYENQTWAKETRESIQNECREIVLASTEELTSDACVVCNPITNWFPDSIKGPYQSFPGYNAFYYVPDCLMPLDGSSMTIIVNESRPGRNYLCGVPDMTEGDTSEWLTKRCVLEFIERELCLYPPLTADYGSKSGRWGFYVDVHGATHIDMLKRCEEEKGSDPCSYSFSTCDTPEASEFFAGIQDQYMIVKNATLDFPENAEEILNKTNAVVAPLIGSTTAYTTLASMYEIYAVRMYMLSHDPV